MVEAALSFYSDGEMGLVVETLGLEVKLVRSGIESGP